MFWQVRAVLEDRPGAMAALAGLCGEHDINILGLQIFPAVGGQVLDEFVLSTPQGWSAERIEELFSSSSVSVTTVVGCSVHVLEDQPVRYLRAARAVMDDPAALSEALCALLGAGSVEDAARRGTPFTDTEIARAAELRRFAGRAAEALPAIEGPAATGERPVLRRGSVNDVELVVAMHQRCSADSLYRRYHVPTPHTTTRLARRLLEPADGWSVVVQAGERVVGIGLVAGEVPEVGLLVEDGWQRQGLGAKLLSALVEQAAQRGITELTCSALPDNSAVPRAIHRAGLRARAAFVDGVVSYTVPVGPAGSEARTSSGRRVAVHKVTAPLVALLHERQELREVYPPADFIDQAVRG